MQELDISSFTSTKICTKARTHALQKTLTLTPSPAVLVPLKHQGSSSFAASQFGTHFCNHLCQEDLLTHTSTHMCTYIAPSLLHFYARAKKVSNLSQHWSAEDVEVRAHDCLRLSLK